MRRPLQTSLMVQLRDVPSPAADRNDLGLDVARQVVGLQERIVEIHYTHHALRLNINNNSVAWLSY